MRNSGIGAWYLPDLGGLLLFIICFLGYFYEVSREVVRKREHRKMLGYSLCILLQLVNLIWLLCAFNLRHGTVPDAWNDMLEPSRVWLFGILELLPGTVFALLTIRIMVRQRRAAGELDNDSISEAILNLPGGFCFAQQDGRVILANAVLQTQIYQMTGHFLTDANVAWNDIAGHSASECDDTKESVLHQTGDGRVWKFRRRPYRIDGLWYWQIDGTDVTELMRIREELQRVNEKISQQNLRTRELIGDIFNKKSEQEILDMQRRVHHEVGQCIVMAKRDLSEPPDPENLKGLLELWEKTFLWIPEGEEKRDMSDREQEICQAARIGGCRVCFRGERPNREALYLLYLAAVREAVTNSMQHAGATEVYVDADRRKGGLQVTIYDNGSFSGGQITEGVGLGKLRKKLEQAGIRMEMRTEKGVSMILSFPEEGAI